MAAAIIAFIRALPEMVVALRDISESLKALKVQAINQELEKIRGEVSETLKKIEHATSAEQRRALSAELAARLKL